MNRFLSLAVIDVCIQVVGFVTAYCLQSEKFYDFAGSVTFVLLAQLSLGWNPRQSSRQSLLTSLVTIWTIRLGSFLFYRVWLTGGDSRFDKVKTKPMVFLVYWLIQGVWVYVTLLPTLIVNSKPFQHGLNNRDYVGLAIWAFGFVFEVMADYQKFVFKNDPNNVGKFIDSGLWSISRHPNYFGEIVLWFGVFVIASSALEGFEWLSIISPLFLYYLLNYVSGVPILERSAMKRYGSQEAYQKYVQSVPVLVPYVGST